MFGNLLASCSYDRKVSLILDNNNNNNNNDNNNNNNLLVVLPQGSSLPTNPLSPGIHIEILQTDLHKFPQRISCENLIIDQGIFSWVIILFILIAYLLTKYGYCEEKIDLCHYWDLKGLCPNYSIVLQKIKPILN